MPLVPVVPPPFPSRDDFRPPAPPAECLGERQMNLAEPARAGDTRLIVNGYVCGLGIGDVLFIGSDGLGNRENVTVRDFGSILTEMPIRYDHSLGETFTRLLPPSPPFLPPLTPPPSPMVFSPRMAPPPPDDENSAAVGAPPPPVLGDGDDEEVNVPVVAASIAAGAALLCLFALLVTFLLRRRRRGGGGTSSHTRATRPSRGRRSHSLRPNRKSRTLKYEVDTELELLPVAGGSQLSPEASRTLEPLHFNAGPQPYQQPYQEGFPSRDRNDVKYEERMERAKSNKSLTKHAPFTTGSSEII